MIRSMTGFGRAQEVIDATAIVVEIRSVNHRYYEYSSRLPRAYAFMDDKLKSFLQEQISRGKVEISVQRQSLENADNQVTVNFALAEEYLHALQELGSRFSLRDDVTVNSLARYPDVLMVRQAELDEEATWNAVKKVTEQALAQFVAAREREGAKMRADLLARAQTIRTAVAAVEARSPQTVREHMEKVKARMRELLDGAAVDESRLLTEAAIYADKIAVAEETVRLCSHLDQMEHLLDSSEPIGRKLDFLVQEMNREANTIGSKCSDLELTRIVVDIKAEIEKIREQIQNIE